MKPGRRSRLHKRMTITLNRRKLELIAITAAATTHIGTAWGITVSGNGKGNGVPDTLRINLSVNLAIDDTSTLMAGTRTNAMADAKAKATQYAAAAGRTLGPVLSIS